MTPRPSPLIVADLRIRALVIAIIKNILDPFTPSRTVTSFMDAQLFIRQFLQVTILFHEDDEDAEEVGFLNARNRNQIFWSEYFSFKSSISFLGSSMDS